MAEDKYSKYIKTSSKGDMNIGKGPGRGRHNMGSVSLKNLDKKTFGRLLSYYKPYLGLVILMVLCTIVSSAAIVYGATYLQVLIDDFIVPLAKVKNPDFSGLLNLMLKMAAIFSLGIATGFVVNLLAPYTSQKIMETVRNDTFSHMQHLPIKFFDTHSHGDLMSRYTNDINTLRQMLDQSLPQLVSSAITIISILVAMLLLSWVLTLVVLFCVFVLVRIIKAISIRSAKYYKQMQKDIGILNGYSEELINGQKVVKVFCHETVCKEEFGEINENLFKSSTKANRLGNIMMPLMKNIGNFQYVLVAIVGGALAINTGMGITIGVIVTFLQLTRNFNRPISQISQQLNFVINAVSASTRVFEIQDQEVEADDGYVTLVKLDENGKETDAETGSWAWKHPHEKGEVNLVPLQGKIEFNSVDFSYVEGKEVLRDVSLYAEYGQHLAFVGSTGAGKTTITNLINRFYDIADGKIRYDGININKIKKADLRHSLGIVLQDTNLFEGSVMENIRYGKLNATDQEVKEAAILANANSFIERLPEGYNTFLTENGSCLSQGQKQLISIARAAIANPPVMVLDEATSSIDTRTEKIVQAGMDSLMKGRTVFVIAHRLSTVRDSDVIMVLENGEIIERGSHKQLLELGGEYSKLYNGVDVLN